MSISAPQRFSFDTIFDGDGDVAFAAPRPKRAYSAEEVDSLVRQAEQQGERQALATLPARQALALAAIAESAGLALGKLAQVAHEHRSGSAELTLACARAIADAALDRFPEAVLQAALVALAREIEAAPRLLVTVSEDLVAGLDGLLTETARAVGFEGAIQVRADAGLPKAGFTLDFGDGAAAFDPAEAADRVAAALAAALASDGLHAEPLIPGDEG